MLRLRRLRIPWPPFRAVEAEVEVEVEAGVEVEVGVTI